MQHRRKPKFRGWNLRGQFIQGRSSADATRPQAALNQQLTRRRSLQRDCRLCAPGARAPRGAGTSRQPLRPRLTVRSRRESGESLQSFLLAACSPPPGVPARPAPAPSLGKGCRGLPSGAGPGRAPLNKPLLRDSRERCLASQLSAEHSAPL